MPTRHIVEQGECIASIAFANGLFPDTVWNHSDNKDLKSLRKSPYILMPGDVVVIPDKRKKEVEKPTGKKHVFKMKGVPEKLVLNFLLGDEPRKNAKYELEIDGNRSEGTTDGNGKVELFIPPNAERGTITFRMGKDEDGEEEVDMFDLHLGHLDPVSEISGVQARLLNLGIYDGPVDGEMNPKFEEAIRVFQERNGLQVTGKLDDQVKNWAERSHGS
jgi:hypothetical protein